MPEYISDLTVSATDPGVGDDPALFSASYAADKDRIQNSFSAVSGAVTATHTELNYVDVTAGTSEASKALVLDASSNIALGTLNNLTAAGTITGGTITDGTGSMTAGALTGVTHALLPVQRGRQTDTTEFTTTSTTYVDMSPVLTVTPASANTVLDGILYVDCDIRNDSISTIYTNFSAGYVNSVGTTVEVGEEVALYAYGFGTTGGRLRTRIALPFQLTDLQQNAGGDWAVSVRAKAVDLTTDATVTYDAVTFTYEEYAE